MTEKILEVDKLTLKFGGLTALDDVSFDIEKSEILGLIGPNGAGKTTLVRVASRGLRPASGTVRVGGLDPYAVPARRAARAVAVVPQTLTPAFPFSALETVLLGRAPYQGPFGSRSSEDWVKARWAMDVAEIRHLSDRPVDELSGGERQRVFLAQTLAQDAPVLLLDEPTTHLDLRHVGTFLGLIRSLAHRDHRAILAVFHDLNLAAAVCDELFLLSAGTLAATGPPAHVLTRERIAEVFGVEADVWVSSRTGRPTIGFAPAITEQDAGSNGGEGRSAPGLRVVPTGGDDR